MKFTINWLFYRYRSNQHRSWTVLHSHLSYWWTVILSNWKNGIIHDVWRLLILSNEEKTNDYDNFEKGMIYMKILKKGGRVVEKRGREGKQLHFHISHHIAHLGWETPAFFYTFYLVYIWHCRIKLFLRHLPNCPCSNFSRYAGNPFVKKPGFPFLHFRLIWCSLT
jgi:hypothetical protein